MGEGISVLTVGEIAIQIRNRMESAGVTNSEWEAREIVRHQFGWSLTEFQLNKAKFVSEATQESLFSQADQRISGQPLAYVLGEWDFYGLTLSLVPGVLIPRSDTETLVDAVLPHLRSLLPAEIRVLDLCCGSGCVGLAIAKQIPQADVVLADLDPLARRVAQNNVFALGLEVNVAEADALSPPFRGMGRFTAIVSNPPYVTKKEYDSLPSSVRDYEPALALLGGDDGLDYYRSICLYWKQALMIGGILACEVGYRQAHDVVSLFRENGFHDIRAIRDNSGIDRVVIGWLT